MAARKNRPKNPSRSPVPAAGPVPLPEAFVAAVSATPGLAESLDGPAPVSVRLNPFKPYSISGAGAPVPWCDGSHGEGPARYLPERPLFTADPAFHGGAYYVQEASSMFIGRLLATILKADGTDAPRILDLCAAPGGKTTHIASVAGPRAVVVANEVIRARARTLAENVQKWGTGNVAVTSGDAADFGRSLPGFFDVVVVDAPCSGEGMFRKDPAARGEWSPDHVELCAARQRRIVSDVWEALRPGGAMIYSTCTFNTAENEENVRWTVREMGAQIQDMDHLVPPGSGIAVSEYEPGCYRFYPHRVCGEGFFVAVLRKPDGRGGKYTALQPKGKGKLVPLAKADASILAGWLGPDTAIEHFLQGGGTVYGYNAAMAVVMPLLVERFSVLYSGVQLGELVRGTLQKPAHALALYYGADRRQVPVTELEHEAALEYLRKAPFSGSPAQLTADRMEPGLNLLTYRGIGLGWAKRVGERYNNLYPQNWRILHY